METETCFIGSATEHFEPVWNMCFNELNVAMARMATWSTIQDEFTNS